MTTLRQIIESAPSAHKRTRNGGFVADATIKNQDWIDGATWMMNQGDKNKEWAKGYDLGHKLGYIEARKEGQAVCILAVIIAFAVGFLLGVLIHWI